MKIPCNWLFTESAMGVVINAQENEDIPYVRSVKRMGQIVMERIMHPFKRFSFTYQFTKTYADEKECLKILHNFTRGVISKRRKQMKEQTPKQFGLSRKPAFLDLLLQMTEQNGNYILSDSDVQEEVDTFMFEVSHVPHFLKRQIEPLIF